jgi:two-component system, NtrC family, response regulator HydG
MDGRILVVDDEPQMGPMLRRTLGSVGLQVESFVDPEAALARLREQPFDVLVTDLRMPGIDGLDVLRRAQAIRPRCETIVITAHASVGSAREALKRGAVDYLTKPFSVEMELIPVIRGVLEAEASEEPRRGDDDALAVVVGPVGESSLIRDVVARAQRVARSSAPVLLLGESGTGKEVFADLIHRASPRAGAPLLRINCAALPDSLLESELFGHAKGAFTGAVRDREGIFAAAHGGTLFLDEIGEMAPNVQPKLLRALQEGEVQRVGESGRSTRVDVRVIAATNRDLREAVKRGSFRSDLYYRLAVVPIEIPPLREHAEDLPALVEHFLARFGARSRFSAAALRAMQRYPWPGNVRELANAVEHAVVLGSSPELQIGDLPAALQDAEQQREGAPPDEDDGTLDAIEQRTILQALARTAYNRSEAARLLGVTRRTLGYRIDKYGLDEMIDRLRTGARASAAEEPARPAMRRVRPRSWAVETG